MRSCALEYTKGPHTSKRLVPRDASGRIVRRLENVERLETVLNCIGSTYSHENSYTAEIMHLVSLCECLKQILVAVLLPESFGFLRQNMVVGESYWLN
jgi:hypothetical protein